MATSMNSPARTRLHWEISAFAELVAQSAEQKAEKADICAELQAIGQRIWGPSAFVAQHGSSMSGAALRSSDLDLVIGGLAELPKPDNPTGNGYLPGARAVVAAQLENLQQVLSEDSEATSSLDLVPHARMPLLKARMHKTDVKITLSPLPVAEIPAHQTAELVAQAFAAVPYAQKLVLLMKALLRDDNYLGSFFGVHSGGVSSYTITLMVIAFCKFQAAQVHADEMDLGWCLLTLLSFYSDANHFNTQSHAIDIASDNGFAQKKDAQAALNPAARQQLADRLCAVDPISRHDIGSGSYRFAELLTHLSTLRLHLLAQMAHAPAPPADVDALQKMTSSTSYRSALSPRRKVGGKGGADASLPPTPLWVKRYLPLLSALINVGAIVPLGADLDPPSPSLLVPGTPPELALASAHGGDATVFMPGHGPMTLGQISNMAYQAAPAAGQFTTEAFPTIQESVAMSTQRDGPGQQPALGQLMYAVSQQQAPINGSAHFERSGSGRRNGWGQGKAHRNNGAGGGSMRPDMYGMGSGDMPRPPTQGLGAAGGGKKGRAPPAWTPGGSTNSSFKSNNAGTQAEAGGTSTAENGANAEAPEHHPLLSPKGLRAPALAEEAADRGKGANTDGHSMRTSSAAALSMRSKSAGTSASSAMSPMLPMASPIQQDATAAADTSRAPTDPGVTASTATGGGSRRRSRSEPPSAAEICAPADRQSAMSVLRGLGKSSSRGRTGGGTTSSATPSTPGSVKRGGSQGSGAHGAQRRNGAGGQGPHQGNHRRHNSFGSNNGNGWAGRGGMRKKDRNGQRNNYPGQGGGYGGGPDGRPQHVRGWHGPPRNNGGGFHQPWRGNHYTPGGGPPAQRHGQQRRGPFPPPNAPAGMQLVPVWPAFQPQQGGQAMAHAPYYMVQPIVPLPQPPQQMPGGNSGGPNEGGSAGGMPNAPHTPASNRQSAAPAAPALPVAQGAGPGPRSAATPPGPHNSGQATPVGSPPVWGGSQIMHPNAMIPPQQIMPAQMMYVPVPAQAVPHNMTVGGSDRKTPGAVPLHLPPHAFGPGGISAPSGQGLHMQGTGFYQRGVFRGPKNRGGGRGGGNGVAGPGPEHSGPRPRGQWGQDGGGRGGYGNQDGYQGHKRRDGPGGGRGGVRWAGGVPVAGTSGSRD